MMPRVLDRPDIRAAENEVMASAELVLLVWQATHGRDCPPWVAAINRLHAAVSIWRDLLRDAGYDSDTNGFDRSVGYS